MRHLLVVIAFGLTHLVGAGGCAAFHHLDEYTTSDSAKPGDTSTHDGGVAVTPESGKTDDAAGCKRNLDCNQTTTRGGVIDGQPVGPSVCIASTGQCAPLLSAECPRVYGDPTADGALVLGTLLGAEASATALEHAAALAAEEINGSSGAGGLPSAGAGGAARPLVVVGCDASGDVVRATRHLVEDLHVPAIVGPTVGEHVVEVTQQVSAKGGTLIMTPTSPVSAISNLADNGLTWRAVPSDTQRAKLVIDQMNALETLLRATRTLTSVKLGIVHPTSSLGTSARDAVSGKLILNGRFINDSENAANVSVDAYQPGDADAQAAIATKYAVTFKPDIVFVTAEEQIAELVVPLEKALTAARAVNRPYYVFADSAKSGALLEAIDASELPSDIRRRIRGVGVKPDAASSPLLTEFGGAFAARYGAPPPSSVATAAAVSYDAMYAIAYAIAATPEAPLSGKSVADGLRALAVGDSAAVGAKGVSGAIQQLVTKRSLSLRGTFGPMQWDTSGDIAAGIVEVWCVGTANGAAVFGSSGLTMDVQTQVVGGAFVQCQ